MLILLALRNAPLDSDGAARDIARVAQPVPEQPLIATARPDGIYNNSSSIFWIMPLL
jgi:hypothetical protein